MENTNEAVLNKEEIGGEINRGSESGIFSIIKAFNKVVGTVFLLGFAGLLVGLHNWVNLTTPTSSYWGYLRSGVASNSSELERVISEGIRATAWMNIIEIGIWILLPSLAITGVVAIWVRGKAVKIAGLLVFAAIFATAQVTNVLGANERADREVKEWSLMFKSIEYPGVDHYNLRTDSSHGGEGSLDRLIEFETSDSADIVENYYKDKGFKDLSKEVEPYPNCVNYINIELTSSDNINRTRVGVREYSFVCVRT